MGVRALCFSVFKIGSLLYCCRFKTCCCVRPRETPVAAAEDRAATYWWYVRSPCFSLIKIGSLLYCVPNLLCQAPRDPRRCRRRPCVHLLVVRAVTLLYSVQNWVPPLELRIFFFKKKIF